MEEAAGTGAGSWLGDKIWVRCRGLALEKKSGLGPGVLGRHWDAAQMVEIWAKMVSVRPNGQDWG